MLSQCQFSTVLEAGAGTGAFLLWLKKRFRPSKLIGTDNKAQYQGFIAKQIEIKAKNEIGGQFDLLVFCDVLHHVDDPKAFLLEYLESYTSDKSYVFIKDMDPRNVICRTWNRLHDLIFSKQRIQEIPKEDIMDWLSNSFRLVDKRNKRIFLYDHYLLLFQGK